jgi:hypothetical protein
VVVFFLRLARVDRLTLNQLKGWGSASATAFSPAASSRCRARPQAGRRLGAQHCGKDH